MKRKAMISMCDKTGNMARPWAEAGYVCICVDIQHSIRATRKKKWQVEQFPGGGEIHLMYGDARSWKPSDFDREYSRKYRTCFVSCFSPCTHVAGSGAQDWELKGIPQLFDALTLFNACEQIADWSGAPYLLENPVGCIGTHHRKPDYYFQPWHFGDMYQKKTCLWTGNGFVMPPAECIVKPEGVTQKIWLAPPGADRADIRSETPEGFARAVFTANNQAPTGGEELV
jgi:hypothetical protein